MFRGLGRSIAFASGGFLAFASAGELVRKSIDAATEAAANQRQLAAQFRASGQSLGVYRKQIEDTTLAVSRLSGFNETELTQSFTTAFRATSSTAKALLIEKTAANAARGSHKDLQTITLALTRAWGGASTSLRRLGILIPKTAKGMDAISFVQRKFAGQAQAGTTAQQRFAAALHNTEISIGSGILPQLNKYLNKATVWLDNSQNQARVQRDVSRAMKVGGEAAHGLADALKLAVAAGKPLVDGLGGVKRTAELAAIALFAVKLKAFAAATGITKLGTSAVVASGEVATLRTRLLGLSKLGPLALVIALDVIPKSKAGQRILDRAGFGFAGHLPVVGGLATEAAVAGNALRTSLGRSDLSQARGAPKPPPGYDPHTYGLAPSTHANPGGYLKKGTAPKGYKPGTYGMAPSTRANSGGYLPKSGKADTPASVRPSKPRASLSYQIALANLQLLKDQVKGSKVAERADLVRLKALTEEKIAKTKDLSKRMTLYQSLAGITGQIEQIDSQAAADRKAAAAKTLAARKKAAAEALKQKHKEAEQAKRQAEKIKAAESKLRDVMSSVHQAFNAALDSARGQIGDLFQGPVLNPTAAQTKQLLGVPGPTVGGLTRDVVAQTRQAKRFNHDLAKLRKQALAGGLSKADTNELIKEFRGLGPAAIPQVEAITGAGAPGRAKFFAGFAGREKFAHRVAQMTVQARTVHISTSKVPIEVTVNLDGKTVAKNVTTHQDRAKGRTASQTRGRHGGR